MLFRLRFFILLLVTIGSIHLAAQCDLKDTTGVYDISETLEQAPHFPGGEKGLLQYLFDIPTLSFDSTETIITTFAFRFIIEIDGSVSNVCPLVHPEHIYAQMLARYLKTMPKWMPGEINGHPVRVRYTLPVRIHLE